MAENRSLRSGYADLHLHTNFSDGILSPEEIVIAAERLGFSAIAIADHDILDGIEPAMLVGEKRGIEVIPGVELSAEANGEEVHILGYYMDWQDQSFREELQLFRDSRHTRAQKMVDKLNQLGVDIKYDDVLKQADSASVGRPHIAAVLVDKGYVANISEAFRRYLRDDGPAYMPKHKLSPAEAITLILDVGGIPILAHPGTLKQDIIPELISCGLMGLEAFHPNHAIEISDYYRYIAKHRNLLITGGSDCHGWPDKTTMGIVKLPYKHVDDLKKTKNIISQQLKRASD